MPVFTTSSVSVGVAFIYNSLNVDTASQNVPTKNPANPVVNFPCRVSLNWPNKWAGFLSATRVSVSHGSSAISVNGVDESLLSDGVLQDRRSADWKAAKAYHEKGLLYEGTIEGFNNGGLLVNFYSLMGFLPFPQLGPYHRCKDPQKTIQDIARSLVGSLISVKVIQANMENKKLIFSEKEALWSKFSSQLNVGNIVEGRVSSIEDYGAFVDLRFPDGFYYLTGLLHVSEVSWDLVHDVRDILGMGDQVRVKIVTIDREKSKIALSIQQLEEDPLLETLDKVIPQDAVDYNEMNGYPHFTIEPLPGLDTIIEELLKEDGVQSVRISRQGFEKRVVSQDLQLWLSNLPPIGDQYTLLARAGRQVQEIQLTTSLDQEGIKTALQHVLERIP